MKTFNLRLEILLVNIFTFTVPVVLIGFIANAIINDVTVLKDYSFLAVLFLIIIIAIIYLGISISYLKEGFGKKVIIDQNTITVITRGVEHQYKINSIIKCYYVKSAESFHRSIFFGYQYLVLILNDYRRIYITNLTANPKEVLGELNLKVHTVETYLPYVDKGIGGELYDKKAYDKEVSKYYASFSEKSMNELRLICRRKSMYSKYALIAAKKLIQEKNQLNN